MAEQQRLTNKQRRAQAREQRRRKEAEAARRRRRDRIRSGLITALVVAVAGALVFQAFFGDRSASLEDQILVAADDVTEAREAAGCETIAQREPLENSEHFSIDDPPPADQIYPRQVRPTHSGPHTAQTHPPQTSGSSSQIDERVTTHNLEHGALIFWYDPDEVDDDTVAEMKSWAERLNDNGFTQNRDATLFVAPYEDPGISSGKALAFRAWGTALDCDEWDETVANGFVAEHYGDRGIAPEAPGFASYPAEVLDFEGDPPSAGEGASDADADGDADGEDAGTEDAGDQEADVGDTDAGDAPGDDAQEDAATDGGTADEE